jgi:hypothetical protein
MTVRDGENDEEETEGNNDQRRDELSHDHLS